ncbi:UDP-glucuronosyl/UDP-glucosyltransferase [Dillenia turbinata]|uniref:UDP-glucuronosyl/UDP-glucosyltransferase n=1 Tax=Dillenia turbinata TaxID=194707 RepID=A0AAN8ZA89_9MAGN
MSSPHFLSPLPTTTTPSSHSLSLPAKFFFFSPRNTKPLQFISRSSPGPLEFTERELLLSIAESNGVQDKSLPCVRSYENDLARLSLAGVVAYEQALTAAAADGGEAADEHIDSRMETMVVETLFPGNSDEHSTVSTRLFLPARKVKEKAKKLRSSLIDDMMANTTASNILAMTFRQVVLQQLWNFELAVFTPGTERNMGNLENLREVSTSFILSSSDQQVISVLAEAACIAALESTERCFVDNLSSNSSLSFFKWFKKPKRITSTDSSVVISVLFEDDVVENAKNLLETFKSMKKSYKSRKSNERHQWWVPSTYAKLEKIGGPEFSSWTAEYVPAYRLQIDGNKYKNLKFEGWKQSADNRWEVILTHSQMVGLAGILDMYFEDLYTLPDKSLSCGIQSNYTKLLKNKRSNSLLRMLSITIASGFFLVSISVLGQFCLPYLDKGRKHHEQHFSVSLPKFEIEQDQPLEATEGQSEAFCVSVVRRIKDAFAWSGEIITEAGNAAWVGKLPIYLRSGGKVDSEESDEDIIKSAQDIASFQVVLSSSGEVVGFQPLSCIAVNHWAANPVAKELYGTKRLSPGLLEPQLKIHNPGKVIIVELLMSMAMKTLHIAMYPWFALGHLTSFLHLSNKLAERGHKISFFIPAKIQSRFEHFNHHPTLITFVSVTVPQVEDLPPGTETTSDIPYSLQPLLVTALDQTKPFIEASLCDLKPHWVFFDFTHWLPSLAHGLGVKSLHYCTISPAALGYLISPARKLDEIGLTAAELMVPPPGFPPSCIKLHAHEARDLAAATVKVYGSGLTLMERTMASMRECDALGFKTCREIEGPYCDYLENQFQKKVILVGPIVPELPSSSLEETWAKWLENFEPKSVVFCAFGSECVLKKDQFQELVLGLELTGLPFFVALKTPFGAETIQSALPKGFRERIIDKGVVHGGWVQQQLILQHPSVGCFVTHCGSGSLSEAMVNECQLVLLPHYGDQMINARLMSGELKVGVEVEKGEDGLFTKESVCNAIKSVMDDNEKGKEVRINHAKWREFLLSEGLERSYVDDFVHQLQTPLG